MLKLKIYEARSYPPWRLRNLWYGRVLVVLDNAKKKVCGIEECEPDTAGLGIS
jgi:hypothetical protein